MSTFNLNSNESATGLGDNDTFNQNGINTTALGGGGNDTFNINNDNAQSAGNDGNDLFVMNPGANAGVNLSGGDGTDVARVEDQVSLVFTFNGGTGTDWLDDRPESAFTTTFNFSGSTGENANGTMTANGGTITGTLVSVEAIVGSDNVGDSFIGGGFNMRFDGYGGNDTAIGGSGNETFLGGAGSDSLLGGNGNDLLTGGTWDAAGVYQGGAINVGTNTLDGGNGNDALIASNAGDLITVGDGTLDYVRLGLGNDTVIADGTSDFVSINGFTAASTAVPGNDADVLRLLVNTGIDTFDELLSHATQYNGANGVFGTLIRTDNGGVIYLDGVNRSSLTATDFIFG